MLTLTKLRCGATCLLSAKTFEEQIMVKLLKPIIEGEQNKKRKEIVRLKDLNFMLKDLTLGYPT